MEGARRQPEWRRRPTWWCTLLTQALLCISLYVACNIGSFLAPRSKDENGGYVARTTRHQDLYFMSVGGGMRPLHQQEQLLRQMENVARKYRAAFIVNLSEFGDDDPLMHNASLRFPSLTVPWYSTVASMKPGRGFFLKQINLPNNRTLSIIGLNTGLWQSDVHKVEPRDMEGDQLHWLNRTLAVSHNDWCLVAGFHSLVDNEVPYVAERSNFCERLLHLFTSHRVDAYLSSQGCGNHYIHEGDILYIQNLSLSKQTWRSCTSKNVYKFNREIGDGFHLHKVSILEIESYFINLFGDVLSTSTMHQWGREDL